MERREVNDWLEHWGVLGMHWGHHKIEPNRSSISKQKKKVPHEVTAKRLTSAELNKRINRIRLETTYVELAKKKDARGQKSVSDFMREQGKTAVTQATQKHMTKLVEVAMAAIAGYAIKRALGARG